MTVRDVFIVMPFTEQTVMTTDGPRRYTEEHFNDIYEALTSAVREHDPSIDVDRMEEHSGHIVTQIIRRLRESDLVIAVLSGKDPNVFYELGIRHSLRRNTIMLVEHRDEYPFDLSGYYSHVFSVEHAADRAALRAFIKERLACYDKGPLQDSPVLETLNQSEYDQVRAINAWETRRAAVVFHGLIAEAYGFFNVLQDVFNFMAELQGEEKPAMRPKMDLLWDMIEGFRHNRPVPGLPTQAYSDAETVYRVWGGVEADWNDTMDTDGELDPDTLEDIVAFPYAATCAYLFDTLTAAEYVIKNKTSFAIPWKGSIDVMAGYDLRYQHLDELGSRILARANEVTDELAVFDRTFTGVPAEAVSGAGEGGTGTVGDFAAVLSDMGVAPNPEPPEDAGA